MEAIGNLKFKCTTINTFPWQKDAGESFGCLNVLVFESWFDVSRELPQQLLSSKSVSSKSQDLLGSNNSSNKSNFPTSNAILCYLCRLPVSIKNTAKLEMLVSHEFMCNGQPLVPNEKNMFKCTLPH